MGMSEVGVTKTDYTLNSGFGLNADTIRYISSVKRESEALLTFRLKALEYFSNIIGRGIVLANVI